MFVGLMLVHPATITLNICRMKKITLKNKTEPVFRVTGENTEQADGLELSWMDATTLSLWIEIQVHTFCVVPLKGNWHFCGVKDCVK